ncbi:unnamed protein product, partial [Closterium sp. NIES-53]
MDLRQKILSTVQATVHEHRHRPHNNGEPPGTIFSQVEDIHATATVAADIDNEGEEDGGIPLSAQPKAQQGAQQSGQKGKWTEQEVLSVLREASAGSGPAPAAAPHSASFGAAAAAFREAGAGAAAAGGSRGGGGSGNSGNAGGAAAGGDDGPTRVQRFLMRLAVALHAYG